MKITEIKTYPLAYEGRESLFIEVLTDNGLKGLGEVGVAKMGKSVIAAIEQGYFRNYLFRCLLC